jgi:hypothetical protein
MKSIYELGTKCVRGRLSTLREADRPDWEWQTGSILRVVVGLLHNDFDEEVN